MNLGFEDFKYIQDLATKNSINITNKSRKKLMSEIYSCKQNETKNNNIPSELSIYVEVNKYKQEYFK